MNRNFNEDKATRVYSRERLENVQCISCHHHYKVKIIEHETNINKNITKYETLHDIFCPQCATPYIGIKIA